MPRVKIATLQLSTVVGDLDHNILHADELLARLEPNTISLLLLPELALTGYNFTSLDLIKPFLEPTNAGPSFEFAVKQAKRLNCVVVVGYPEVASEALPPATFPSDDEAANYSLTDDIETAVGSADGEHRYNTVVAVSPAGEVLSTYRKHFLYYTDQRWATRGPSFSSGLGTLEVQDEGLQVPYAHGICMDLNPFQFQSDRWEHYEYASHIVMSSHCPRLILLSNAWNLTAPDTETEEAMQEWEESVKGEAGIRPDWGTVEYWASRLRPVIMDDTERIVLISNHCGREGSARYAGSSCALKVGSGRVSAPWAMGVAEEGVLVCEVNL